MLNARLIDSDIFSLLHCIQFFFLDIQKIMISLNEEYGKITEPQEKYTLFIQLEYHSLLIILGLDGHFNCFH